jgi:nucleoside-diphosphate-sugar epimerase
LIEGAGARAVVADALDEENLSRAVRHAQPTHVVNLLTALPPAGPLRPKDLRPTNVLRSDGAANLLRASIDAGVRRIVAESFVGVIGDSGTGQPLREEQALAEVRSSDPMRETIFALRSLERMHAEAGAQAKIETVVLRFGLFYGPDVPSTESLLSRLRAGRLFAPKRVEGVASWIYIDDAVSATVAALEHPRPAALYNVVDDEPAGLDIFLAEAARAFQAPAPRPVPRWLLRLAAPLVDGMGSAYLALDNARAKRELNWRPLFPDIRAGLLDLAVRARNAA